MLTYLNPLYQARLRVMVGPYRMVPCSRCGQTRTCYLKNLLTSRKRLFKKLKMLQTLAMRMRKLKKDFLVTMTVTRVALKVTVTSLVNGEEHVTQVHKFYSLLFTEIFERCDDYSVIL